MIRWTVVTKEEGLRLRGLAIVVIALHNFTHLIRPLPAENEFNFRPERFASFMSGLLEHPEDFWRLFFSYFGHYGVEIFIFLSAYGLTRRLVGSPSRYAEFLKRRILALYPTVIVCGALFLVYESVRIGAPTVLTEKSLPLVGQILLVSNFIRGAVFDPIGPWWFLSMIFQFYLLFPFLLRGFRSGGGRFLILVSFTALLMEMIFNDWLLVRTGVSVNYTVIGYLPAFSLGMWAAERGEFQFSAAWALLAVGVFALGQLSATVWVLASPAFLVWALPATRAALDRLGAPSRTSLVLRFVGVISLDLFLVNGFLRQPWLNHAQGADDWKLHLGLSLAFLAWSLLWAVGGHQATARLRPRLSSSGDNGGEAR